jgi:hypothetical protein
MELITSPTALRTEFSRLMRQYERFRWITAWAGASYLPFAGLLAASKKIQHIVVGIHFYQTHPDFIEALIGHKGVRFITQPEGAFRKRINTNDVHVSRALDAIPLFGELTKSHYDGFIAQFRKTFPGNFVGTATRLLALKRPDTFVCLDSKNRAQLCTAFGIPQAAMNYDRYWNEIVLRIRNSDWWLHPTPTTPIEETVSESRGAFLDSIAYRWRQAVRSN